MEDFVFLLHKCHQIRELVGEGKVGNIMKKCLQSTRLIQSAICFMVKLIHNSQNITQYFQLVQKYEPEFRILSPLEEFENVENAVLSSFDFTSISYTDVFYKGKEFANCMEVVVRDVLRLDL